MADLLARQIDGITALVTGANRGLGKEFTQVLLDAGAAKVYAGARDPSTIEVTDTRVVPVRLDITNPGDIAAATRDCTDVSLVINNAGAMLQTPFVSAPDMSAARTEMETNYFGTLAMARAFGFAATPRRLLRGRVGDGFRRWAQRGIRYQRVESMARVLST